MPRKNRSSYDYHVYDADVPLLVERFKREGREIKYRMDGTPSRAQFNPFMETFRFEQKTKKEKEEKEAVLAVKEKLDNLELTPEMMQSVLDRYKKGEITESEAKMTLLYKYKRDPLYMATKLFRDMTIDRAKSNPDGSPVYTPSPKFHQEIVDELLTKKRVAIGAPRGHAKSTLVGFFYVLHQALFELKKNIVIVSATEDLAIRFLRDIKTECEVNKLLIWLFGPQMSDKWSEKEIQLANGCRIYAKGRGGQLRGLKERGTRPDLIILDDLEDSELVRSELRRIDLEDWFNSDVLPTLEPSIGQLVFIGTILHESSLLNRVLDKTLYPDFTTHIYSAIIRDENGVEVTLWPERFSLEMLLGIKESYAQRGQLANFFMEYMNDPMPSEGASFRSEYFQYFDDLPSVSDPYVEHEMVAEMFVDLGGGGLKRTSDDTAMMAVVTDRMTGKVYVEDYVAERMGVDTDRILTTLFRLAEKHDCGKLFLEKTAATNMLVSALERKIAASRKKLRVELITPTRGSGDRRGNMSDGKFQRIAALEAPFKMGEIKMRRWMTKLQEQLLAFPRGQHDDLLDCLAYAYMYAKKQRKNSKQQWKPRHRNGYLNRPLCH